MCVEFVFGSLPLLVGIVLVTPVFHPPLKPTFQIPVWPGNSVQEEPPCGMPIAKFPLLLFCELRFLYLHCQLPGGLG